MKDWTVGQYEPTDSFKNIKNHSCVCDQDKGLIALTGPADDKESQQLADLFAVAPDMLNALKHVREQMPHIETGVNNGSENMLKDVFNAIDKAEGK